MDTAPGGKHQTLTEIFTPTSIALSGVTPPITAATTVTTTDSTGQTVAIAIAAGAGVVGAGALAAWLFKPVPGAPPAPTQPPPYRTVSQINEPETTSEESGTTSTAETTSSEAVSCPFPTSGFPISFAPAATQPQWTFAIPSATPVSQNAPKCSQQGSNSQLLRGTDPGYINALAQVFCKSDLSKSQSATLGQSDLPDGNQWKNAQLDSIRVKFDFGYSLSDPGCAQNCVDAYQKMTTSCKVYTTSVSYRDRHANSLTPGEYNSHILYGNAELQQGCGLYSLAVDADVITKLTCNPAPDVISDHYEYRDDAMTAINDFCTARDGAVIKQNDQSTNIQETVFSIKYADKCTGSGSYTVDKDTCVKYLSQTVDGCDVDTTMFKHGGTLLLQDNCISFAFNPNGVDSYFCYPKNMGTISSGTHVQITSKVAQDAISQFCDRDGGDQQYTLDPDNIPDPSSFAQDACTTKGMAECTYYYHNDGSRATGTDVGNYYVKMNAQYINPGVPCGSNETYAIHGDR